MQLHSARLFNRIAAKLLDLLEDLRAARVYTNITEPGAGAHKDPGQQTIHFVFGTTVAGIAYCLQVFVAPDYNTPTQSVPILPVGATTFDLAINIAENTSYMFRVVPCDPGDMIVIAGSTGLSSSNIE